MFDISFSELMVIAVVALVVIGPERLPKVARTLGILLGRFNRYVGNVKADIEREMRVDELKKFQQQVEDGARNAEHLIVEETQKAQDGVMSVADSLNTVGEQALAAPAESTAPVSPAAVTAETTADAPAKPV